MSRKWLKVCGLCLAMSIGLGSSAIAEVIKIGGVLPLTDWGAAEGNYIRSGAEIAVEKINSAGGINGKQLEMIMADGRNDPADSLNAAQKLVNRDNVSVLFGCYLSSATLAVIPVVERAGVPFLVETSGALEITHPAKPFVFRTSTLFSQEADAARKAIKALGVKKACFVAQDNDYGRGSVTEFKRMLGEEGIEIGDTHYIDAASSDYYPILTNIKNSNADIIIATLTNPGFAKILEQAYELGLTQKVLTTGGSSWPYTIAKLNGGTPTKGSYHLSFFAADFPQYSPNPAEAEYYVNTWKARNLPWDGIQDGARGYEAIMTIAEGLRAANGSSERKEIRDALEKIERKGIIGMVKFDEYHDIEPNIMVLHVVGDKGEYVLSPELNDSVYVK